MYLDMRRISGIFTKDAPPALSCLLPICITIIIGPGVDSAVIKLWSLYYVVKWKPDALIKFL